MNPKAFTLACAIGSAAILEIDLRALAAHQLTDDEREQIRDTLRRLEDALG